MPRLGLNSTFNSDAFRPIIRPATGDSLETQLRLAQIANLQSEGQDRTAQRSLQALSLQEQRAHNEAMFKEGATHNIEEEKHWANLIGVDKEKLAEMARQHNQSLSELSDYHKNELKTQLTSQLAGHLINASATNPAYSPDIIMSMLAKRDVPELLAAHTEIAGKAAAEKAAKEAANKAAEDAILGGKQTPYGPPLPPSDTPGYFPGAATNVRTNLKYAPLDFANAGISTLNTTAVPVVNALGSLIGTPPIHRVKPLKREYTAANFGF